jgi:hypothetical protein
MLKQKREKISLINLGKLDRFRAARKIVFNNKTVKLTKRKCKFTRTMLLAVDNQT